MSAGVNGAVAVPRAWGLGLALCLMLVACACGPSGTRESQQTSNEGAEPTWGGDIATAGGYEPWSTPEASSASAPAPMAAPAPREEVATALSDAGFSEEAESDSEGLASRPQYAQAPAGGPAPRAPSAPPAAGAPAAPPAPAVMSDGRSGPLLIYEAHLRMGSYKIDETQRQAIAVVKELGGFMSQQQDQAMLVLRVPAQQFYTALERIETLGQVTQRHVRSQDVTDAFRDLEMRLRNAEAVRDRLVKLLDKATDVRQSLEVEHELDRLTERIELLKGQLKSLGDRIAFSTITIVFQPKRDETINPDFQLPFEWLRFLGLQHLLSLPTP